MRKLIMALHRANNAFKRFKYKMKMAWALLHNDSFIYIDVQLNRQQYLSNVAIYGIDKEKAEGVILSTANQFKNARKRALYRLPKNMSVYHG